MLLVVVLVVMGVVVAVLSVMMVMVNPQSFSLNAFVAKASWEQCEKNIPRLWLGFFPGSWFGGGNISYVCWGWRLLRLLSGQLQYYLEHAVCKSDGTTGNYREISVFHCQAFKS